MKILHTSDWHIGKALRGISRLDEQQAVLAEIAALAAAEAVDLVLVVGDVFETSVPSPEAQRLAWRALLDLRETGAEVVVIAGNHDNAHLFEALKPVFAGAGICLLGRPAMPSDGGVLRMTLAGEPAVIALVPFCSQRSIIKSADLMDHDGAENAATYADRMRGIIAALSRSFDASAVNIIAAHAFVRGGMLGGGERDAQTIEDYWVDATSFGSTPHYVALGHLHFTQEIPGPCPIWYSGAPIQVDFGEAGDDKHVLVLEAHPGIPAAAPRRIKLTTPRRLRTVKGTFDELSAQAGDFGDDLLRVVVNERTRAGLAADVREMLPNAVDVFIERPDSPDEIVGARNPRARSARDLFAEYLETESTADERVTQLFDQLLDEMTSEPIAAEN